MAEDIEAGDVAFRIQDELETLGYEIENPKYGDFRVCNEGEYICDVEVVKDYTPGGLPNCFIAIAVKVSERPKNVKTICKISKGIDEVDELVTEFVTSI